MQTTYFKVSYGLFLSYCLSRLRRGTGAQEKMPACRGGVICESGRGYPTGVMTPRALQDPESIRDVCIIVISLKPHFLTVRNTVLKTVRDRGLFSGEEGRGG